MCYGSFVKEFIWLEILSKNHYNTHTSGCSIRFDGRGILWLIAKFYTIFGCTASFLYDELT